MNKINGDEQVLWPLNIGTATPRKVQSLHRKL
jgi:hypothetical protein